MTVIRFDCVSKFYPRYHRLRSGLKASLLQIRHTLRSQRVPPTVALDNVSFEVARHETIGIIGPNGSGKSTALALIAGVLNPQKGSIEVHGRIAPLLELGAGFHPELTGRENIVLNAVLLGLTRREVSARLDSIIDFCELDSYLDEPIRTYSSGMIARLGFSIAVFLDHEILLLDEVFAVGDLSFKAKCYAKIGELKQRGSTIVLVTHSIEEATQLCDRLILLDGGKIVADGRPDIVTGLYAEKAREHEQRRAASDPLTFPEKFALLNSLRV